MKTNDRSTIGEVTPNDYNNTRVKKPGMALHSSSQTSRNSSSLTSYSMQMPQYNLNKIQNPEISDFLPLPKFMEPFKLQPFASEYGITYKSARKFNAGTAYQPQEHTTKSENVYLNNSTEEKLTVFSDNIG